MQVTSPLPVDGTVRGRLTGLPWSELVAWGVLLSAVVFFVPLFVCMPLTQDTLLYDLCARVVLHGGVLYRDIFDNNLPGAVWVHCGLISLLGNRSEVIRLFDLAVFALIVVLLVVWLARAGRPRPVLVWTAALLWLFYSSRSEWCHCQRDTWMLLPALAALHLRRRQLSLLTRQKVSASHVFLWAVAEGVLWGVAVWIKPFVLVPAAAAYLIGAIATRCRATASRWRLTDIAGLLAGGLLVGGSGVGWLIFSGAWPYFWDIMLHWNNGYYAQQTLALRFTLEWARIARFFPWSLVHLPALLVAAVAIPLAFRARITSAASDTSLALALLAAFYLGWEAQALFLQYYFDYIHTPPLLLALALVAEQPMAWRWPRAAWVAFALFLATAAGLHPLLQLERRAVWVRCWQEGSTPELRNRLWVYRVNEVDWVALAHVADYLRDRAGPGDLTCFSQPALGIYKETDLTPATRYGYVDVVIHLLPNRRSDVLSALDRSGQRFLLMDVETAHLPQADADLLPPDGEQPIPYEGLSSRRHDFPWSAPIVFRAGRYVVHRVRQPSTSGP
jgi:hypothetical protein